MPVAVGAVLSVFVSPIHAQATPPTADTIAQEQRRQQERDQAARQRLERRPDVRLGASGPIMVGVGAAVLGTSVWDASNPGIANLNNVPAGTIFMQPDKLANGSITYRYQGGAAITNNAVTGEHHRAVPNTDGTGNALNNTITGNAANNVLTGGAGADTFVWQAGARGTDTLTDFSLAQADTLDVKALLQSIAMGSYSTAAAASYLDLRQGLGANAADAVLTVHAANNTTVLQTVVLTNTWAELQDKSIEQMISQGVLVA